MTRDNGNEIRIHSIYKSADLWRRTGMRPEIAKNPANPAELHFVFPNNSATIKALEQYEADDNGIKSFVHLFLILRSELYLLKTGRPQP